MFRDMWGEIGFCTMEEWPEDPVREARDRYTHPKVTTDSTELDPDGLDAHAPGAKLDDGKTKAGVLEDFALALDAVAQVGTMGANKYTRGGWQHVKDGETRYKDAKWRHLLVGRHEDLDPESGYPHEWHEAWNVLAKLELRRRREMSGGIGRDDAAVRTQSSFWHMGPEG